MGFATVGLEIQKIEKSNSYYHFQKISYMIQTTCNSTSQGLIGVGMVHTNPYQWEPWPRSAD